MRKRMEVQNAKQEIHTDRITGDFIVHGLQTKQQGISDIFIDRNPQIIDFYTGKEFEKWEKEVDMIMKMGG